MRSIVNTGQAEAWNGYEGGHWADHQDRYDAVNSGFNDLLLDAAAIGDRDRVLDIGCGNGQLTRLAARRARHAYGIDLSGPMLARARASSAANVTYERGDAQVHPIPPGHDVAVSRFGVMFFADPVAGFANIGSALRPGGRLAILSLRPMNRTDLGGVFAAMAEHLPAPPATTEPGAPGPESLADPGRIREVLTTAGFTDVAPVPVEAPQLWGSDAEDAAGFLGGWGPVRFALGKVDDRAAARARAALTDALRPYEGPGGVVLTGAAWLTTATWQHRGRRM